MTQEEWMRRYRQTFMDVAGLSESEAKEMAEAIGFKEASSEFEDDPEGAAQMEMSYWD